MNENRIRYRGLLDRLTAGVPSDAGAEYFRAQMLAKLSDNRLFHVTKPETIVEVYARAILFGYGAESEAVYLGARSKATWPAHKYRGRDLARRALNPDVSREWSRRLNRRRLDGSVGVRKKMGT